MTVGILSCLKTERLQHPYAVKRYTCVHPTCLPISAGLPIYYPTWTALQHHLRTVHPPTCSHPSCNNRIFSSQKGLRAHQKLHEHREIEAEWYAAAVDSGDDGPSRKKRRGGNLGRDWKCEVDGCEKDFKSVGLTCKHPHDLN
jgi:hypothetical protein